MKKMKLKKRIGVSDEKLDAWNDKLDGRIEQGFAILEELRGNIIESPEGRLWFAVFRQTIMDLTIYDEREEACAHIKRGRFHELEMAGVDNSYARRVIKKLGIDLTMP
jgi:hypothetical protein